MTTTAARPMPRRALAAIALLAATACGKDDPTPPETWGNLCGSPDRTWDVTTSTLVARVTLDTLPASDSVTGTGAFLVTHVPLTLAGSFRRDTLRLRIDGWPNSGDTPRYVMLTCPDVPLPHAFRGYMGPAPDPTSGERFMLSQTR